MTKAHSPTPVVQSRVLDPATELDQRQSLGPLLPLARVGAAVEILLCSGFPTQLLLLGLLTAAGMPMKTGDGHLSPPFVFTLSLADTILVIGLVFVFFRAHGERAREILLGPRRTMHEVIVGLALLPIIFVFVLSILLVILLLAPQLHNVPRNPLEDMLRNRGDAMIFAVVVMIAGGVREEVQRGFILHRFDRYLGGGMVGLVLFSALFGLGHIDQGIDAAIATGLLGAFWGAVYLARRSIVAPMVSHAAFNLAQLVKYLSFALR
jgi:membrane protease YdiL (CAAX protease family)